MLNCVSAGSDFRLVKYICYCMTNLHAQLTCMHLHSGWWSLRCSPVPGFTYSLQLACKLGRKGLSCTALCVQCLIPLPTWACRSTAATQTTLIMPRCSLHMQIWHIVGHLFCAWNSTVAFLTTCFFSTVSTLLSEIQVNFWTQLNHLLFHHIMK